MNVNAANSHNPFQPLNARNNVLPDQAIYNRDGSIKPGGTDTLSSLSPAIQDRIAALKSQASTDSDDAAHGRFLTIDGLKKAWGESDSIYDLNGDGTVNVSDLLKLLAEGGTMAHPDAPLTIDGLLQVWGQSNAAYDLNADGTVNVTDLLQMLAQLGEEPAPADAIAPAPLAATADPADTPIAASTLEKPISSTLPAEKPATRIDITGKDPIADTTPLRPGNSGNPGIPDPLDALTSYPIRSFGELRDIAHAIFQRLMGAGYELKPPANIHSVVNQLQLSRPQKQAIIERLAQQYPRGLGINFVG